VPKKFVSKVLRRISIGSVLVRLPPGCATFGFREITYAKDDAYSFDSKFASRLQAQPAIASRDKGDQWSIRFHCQSPYGGQRRFLMHCWHKLTPDTGGAAGDEPEQNAIL
jgi:hypothetical protein